GGRRSSGSNQRNSSPASRASETKSKYRIGNDGAQKLSATRTANISAARRLPTKRRVRSILLQPAKTAFAGCIILQCLMKQGGIEFGPAFRCDPDFGIGDLPEQIIADTHFAGREDEQIGVRHAGGVKRVDD